MFIYKEKVDVFRVVRSGLKWSKVATSWTPVKYVFVIPELHTPSNLVNFQLGPLGDGLSSVLRILYSQIRLFISENCLPWRHVMVGYMLNA